MSRRPFWREHALLMRASAQTDHDARIQEAFEGVRDKWIAEQRYHDLARVILTNWTGGNCVAFMAPLNAALIAAEQFELHGHLWRTTIKRQADKLFWTLAQIEGKAPPLLRLLNVDVSGFAETDSALHARPDRAAAYLLQQLMGDLQRWRHELQSVGRATDEIDAIESRVRMLKKPRIKGSRMPAEYTADTANTAPVAG